MTLEHQERRTLADDEDLLRAFVRHSEDGIIIVDDQGTILEWSEGEERISGISASEAVGHPIWALQHRLAPDAAKTDEYLLGAREQVLRGLQEGVSLKRTLEDEIQRPDGTRRVVQSKLLGIRSGKGELVAVAICRDITERRQLEDELRQRQGLLLETERLARLGHWDKDLRSSQVVWSEEVYGVLGHVPGSIAPSDGAFLEAVAAEDRERVAAAFSATLRDGTPRQLEFRVVMPRGNPRWVKGSVGLLGRGDGAPGWLIGTVQDVTERKRDDERLRAHEERLSLAISASGQGLWDWDLAADTAYLSPEYLRLSGHTEAQVHGAFEFFRGLVHPDDFPQVQKTLEEHFQGRSARSVIEYRMKRRSGEYAWIQGVGRITARDEAGTPLRMTGVISDITDRKRLEEELRERQSLLLEAERLAHVGHWHRDLRSGMSFWSDEVYRLLGQHPGSVAPGLETFVSAVVPEDRERISELLTATARDGMTRRAEYRVVGADGTVHTVYGTVELLRDSRGAPARLIGTVQDVTERKMMEQEIADASRRKDEFLAMLSHELRNPLAPLHQSLYLLAHTEPRGEQTRAVERIIGRQLAHLTRLVDDLLDITRVSRGRIQIDREPVELGEVVSRVVEDHASTFAAGGVRLEGRTAPQPMWLTADRVRIAQVIGNLLTNAAKFTPAGGRVDVALEQEGEEAVLRVRDSGVGMTPDVLGRLFQPFMLADPTLDRRHGGLGLGLALAKGLVAIHGGSISAASGGPGRGAEFTVRLPLDPAAAAAATAPQEKENGTRAARPRRVLVIEDSPDAAGTLKMALELDGHQVEVAYDGSSGLTRARAFHPEIVFCDVGLPGIDGYEVARAFRADEALKAAFLVALTGYARSDDLQRAEEAGFHRHVSKPPDVERLLDLVAEVSDAGAGATEAGRPYEHSPDHIDGV